MPRLLVVVLLLLVATVAACSGDEAADPAPLPARNTSDPTSAPARFDEYVALGDSYTAAPLVPPTDTDTTCLRSKVNYPALVAGAMPGTALTDVSCGGATTASTTHPQRGRTGAVPPQLDAVSGSTDLVTIGLGVNDQGLFGHVLVGCTRLARTDPGGRPCTAALGPELGPVLRQVRRHLAAVVVAVRERAPRARIVVVGYPQIVPAADTCAELPLAAGDYAFARRVNAGVVRAVERAARDAHADYVDVWRASAGHDICAAEPWINGDVTSVDRALAYHPLAVEQRRVADLVLATLRE